MPTYEYRCKGCGGHLEVVQAFTDDALTTCDECGGDLRKVFGNVGISFKGSGFYKTDSRRSSSSSASEASSSSDASSSGSSASSDSSSSTSSSDAPSGGSTTGSSGSSSSSEPAKTA